MFEAFDHSAQTLALYAGWVGSILGGLALSFSLLQLAAVAMGTASRLRRPKVLDRPEIAICDRPLRPDLDPRNIALAQHTRTLMASIAAAPRVAGRWREAKMGEAANRWLGAANDADYLPTIAATGEIWSWLHEAQAVTHQSSAATMDLKTHVDAIREALLCDAELSQRFAYIVDRLAEIDEGFRCQSSATPYRHSPVTPAKESQADAEEDRIEDRREIYLELVTEHKKAIDAIARRYTNDSASSDDLRQDILVAIWTALPKFRGDASLKTYLLRIAHYCGSRFARRRFRASPEFDYPDPSSDAEAWLDDVKRNRNLSQALEDLPSSQREAVKLLLAGASYREIAQRQGITVSNASVRITRARRSLRCALASA